MSTSFTTKLEELGYFNGLSPAATQGLKQEFDRKGWDALFEDSHRLFFADAENLAEGDVGKLLREASPFLTSQGVTLPAIEDDISGDGYVVKVGGIDFLIYDADELQGDFFWALASVRGFGIINELLTAAGSKERAYAINGGNDLQLLFLTPELHQAIMEHPDASRRYGPYLLREEPPWFGQPEG